MRRDYTALVKHDGVVEYHIGGCEHLSLVHMGCDSSALMKINVMVLFFGYNYPATMEDNLMTVIVPLLWDVIENIRNMNFLWA